MNATSRLLSALFAILTLGVVTLATGASAEPQTRTLVVAGCAIGAIVFWIASRATSTPIVIGGSLSAAFAAGVAVAIVGGSEGGPAGISRLSDFRTMMASCTWLSAVITPFVALPLCAIRLSARKTGSTSAAKTPFPATASALVLILAFVVGSPMLGGPMFDGPPQNASGEHWARQLLHDLSDAEERVYDSTHTYTSDLTQLAVTGPWINMRIGMGMRRGERYIDRADASGWLAHTTSEVGNWACQLAVARTSSGTDHDASEARCTRNRRWFSEYGGARALQVDMPSGPFESNESVSFEAWVSPGGNHYTRLPGELRMRSTDTSIVRVETEESWDPGVHRGTVSTLRSGHAWIIADFQSSGESRTDSLSVTVRENAIVADGHNWRDLSNDQGRVVSIDTSAIERRGDSTYVVWYREREARSFMDQGTRVNTLRQKSRVRCRPLQVEEYRIEWAMNDGPASHTWTRSTFGSELRDAGLQHSTITRVCAYIEGRTERNE